MIGDLALYIHWPFCAQKCPYCDFNSHVRERIDAAAWGRAYVQELRYYRDWLGPRRITSIFFGGGTPSLMPPDIAGLVIQTINDLWGLDREIEVTLEANPNSSEVEKFKAFKSNGINRLSVGIQSLNDQHLKFLGRLHNAAEGRQAIAAAQSVFDRFSFDLIYARPGQTTTEWELELRQALTIAGDHLSLYQLTIEPQTPFYTARARGDFAIPDDDTAAELYTLTDGMMTDAGRPPYEVSNYARKGQESQHNLTYWRYGDYAGVGPGAHGRVTVDGQKYATTGHRAPEIWLGRVGQNGHGLHPTTLVPPAERGVEALMMGLRLTSGLPLSRLAAETGAPWSATVDPERLERLVELGDLDCRPSLRRDDSPVITPTLQGRLRLNQVIAYLRGS